MSQAWFKFYPADWRSDPALRLCGLAARGLWQEMLCLMHEAEPYGYLRVNGVALTAEQLAMLVGAQPKQVKAALAELRAAAVFSEDERGIYSRRMVRDRVKAEQAKEWGRGGGNPNLTDNRGVNPTDNVSHARDPEARSQKPDKENRSSPRGDALSRDFAEWYDRYPRKVAKASAEKAYRAARKQVDAQTLHDGLTRYLDNKPGYQDWKHPATWLNGRCWEDDYGPPDAPTGWKASELEALQ